MLAVFALACSDGIGPPAVTPQELQILSGAGQTTRRGEDVPAPLRVRLIGSDEQPLSGATVQWAVIQGQATLDPAQSSTSSTGEAEARVTNVATIGTVVVRARVQGAADTASLTRTFSITALDPCSVSSMPTYQLGILVAGVLRPLDCRLDDQSIWDFYTLSLTAQQAVAIRVRSDSFTPAVHLWTLGDVRHRGGVFEDRPGETEALMKAILAPGAYAVGVNSFNVGATGPYELLVSATSTSVECELVFVVRGIATAQQLTPSDCPGGGAPFYEDGFWLVLHTGERLIVTQSSAQFRPHLRLQQPSGAVLEADGSAAGTATIDFTADRRGLYRIAASSALAQQTGEYTLAVSYPPGAAASEAAAPNAQFVTRDPLHIGVRSLATSRSRLRMLGSSPNP